MRIFFLYISFLFSLVISGFVLIKIKFSEKHTDSKKIDQYAYKYVSNWAKSLINKIGIKVKVEGIENIPKDTCLFVANHQGIFDILVLLASIDKSIGFIAKKELLKFKIISSWMKRIHCVFMDRSDIRASMKSINKGVEYLKEGHSMVIFPEGTRSKGPKLGEFKKGSMKLATKAKVPIVPVTIRGTYKVFEGNGNKIKGENVNLIIGKPIYIDNFTREEQRKLSEIVREKIFNTLE